MVGGRIGGLGRIRSFRVYRDDAEVNLESHIAQGSSLRRADQEQSAIETTGTYTTLCMYRCVTQTLPPMTDLFCHFLNVCRIFSGETAKVFLMGPMPF